MGELVKYLQLLLAEATNSRDEAMCAQIDEVLRCITSVFDDNGCVSVYVCMLGFGLKADYRVHKLLKVLREENKERAHYFAYLHQSRLTLLKLNSMLNRAKMRLDRFAQYSFADTIQAQV